MTNEFGYEKNTDQWLIANYLKYGSVEAVLNAYNHNIPFSVAEYHRRVKKAGIIKSEGRSNKSFAQALYIFLHRAAHPNDPLEKIYTKLPLGMREAQMSSIYRIYDAILKKNSRRLGVGAIISPEFDQESILVADEKISMLSSGKRRGDITIPFGFASKKHSFSDSVLRILQREFSTNLTLSGGLVKNGSVTNELIPAEVLPFLDFQILDLRLQVAHIILPAKYCDLKEASSFTVENHRFIKISDVLNRSLVLRTGVGDVVKVYKKYLEDKSLAPFYKTSAINLAILASYT